MNKVKTVGFALVIILITGFLGFGLFNNSEEKEINEPWDYIYLIGDLNKNKNFDKARYSCGEKRIIVEPEKNYYNRNDDRFLPAASIKILPENIILEKIDGFLKFKSYTFDTECKNIYAIVYYTDNNKIPGTNHAADLFSFSTENGKHKKLTENLASYSNPIFIYFIKHNKLLISFFTLSAYSGGDERREECINFQTHKIFDLSKNKFSKEISFKDHWLSGSWFVSPTILNFKTNILSTLIQPDLKKITDKNRFSIPYKRIDFDLINESFFPEVIVKKKKNTKRYSSSIEWIFRKFFPSTFILSF